MTAPWTSSESTAAIIPAFVDALQTFEDVKKTRKVNAGQMAFTYADLAAVLDNTKKVLSSFGLAITQSASTEGVQTIVLHKSGEWLAFPPLKVATQQNTPQGQGSALTYARRYSMLAVLGIATEDDDGHAAATAPKPQRRPATTDDSNPGTLAKPNQITRLQIRLKECGITTRDDKIGVCCALIGRTITSSKQMTTAEVSKVLDGLDRLEAGLLEVVTNDDGTLTVKEAA